MRHASDGKVTDLADQSVRAWKKKGRRETVGWKEAIRTPLSVCTEKNEGDGVAWGRKG